jgi:hypothetical protein
VLTVAELNPLTCDFGMEPCSVVPRRTTSHSTLRRRGSPDLPAGWVRRRRASPLVEGSSDGLFRGVTEESREFAIDPQNSRVLEACQDSASGACSKSSYK